MFRFGLLLCSLALVTGCIAGPAGETAKRTDPLQPPGPAPGNAIVDPLVVGDRLLAAGETELALDSYTRAAAGPAGPDVEVRRALASTNIALGRLGQAEDLLRGIVAEAPRDAAARNDLAVVLYERGEIGESYRMFRTAFALQPSPEIRANLRLADARLRRGTYDETSEDGAFTLTARGNGIYDLTASAQP